MFLIKSSNKYKKQVIKIKPSANIVGGKFLFVTFILIIFLLRLSLDAYSNESVETLKTEKLVIDTNRVKTHINYLASDLFEGRAPGTLGSYLSAKYLAYYFDKYGLIPLGDDDTYYQNIAMHTSKIKDNTHLILKDKDGTTKEFKHNTDFVLFKFGKRIIIPKFTKLIFAGYGITAPEYDYDDYHSINVENKIVVILDGEPYSNINNYFEGMKSSQFSVIESKYRNAISKGAIGVIIINDFCSYDAKNWLKNIKEYSFPSINLAQRVTNNFASIINYNSAIEIFKSEEIKFETICENHIKGKIQSFELKSEISFKGNFEEIDFVSPNIVGFIEGRDEELKNEYVVISAHYDHLGIVKHFNENDSIYNGMTDNALGTAVLLEIANHLNTYKLNKRSLIFLLTTGEEFGLLGSTYYTQNPIKPLYNTIVNVNIDGVAFFDEFKEIVCIGEEHTNIDEILNPIANKYNLTIGNIPNNFQQEEAYRLSDNYSFSKVGIPSFLLIEGTKYVNYTEKQSLKFLTNYSDNIYHSVNDDLSIPINLSAVNLHTNILIDFILALTNTDKKIEFIIGSPFKNASIRMKKENNR